MTATSRTSSARTFAARARHRRLRRLLAVLAGTGVVLVVSAAVWLVGWSSVLAVGAVKVHGVGDGLAERVESVADVPTGVPLARVDTGAIAGRVRELVEVAGVEVHRSWPDTLTIEVAPRVGVASIVSESSDGATWWQVDDSGVMFGESAEPHESLPVLTAPVGADADAVRAAGVAVLTDLPGRLRDLVAGVEAKSEADIRLALDGDVAVRWGTADRIDEKAQVLLALLEAQDSPPTAYDVSAPEHPAIVP